MVHNGFEYRKDPFLLGYVKGIILHGPKVYTFYDGIV